jgi:hypothetical protein
MSSVPRARVQDSDVKPAKLPEHAYTRLWFWNNAGAQTLLCPVHEAAEIKERLLSSGAVVWHTEVYNA